MKVAVVGANGQLGSDICKVYKGKGYDLVELLSNSFNIKNIEQCRSILAEQKPELLINTAAMHNVEKCEDNPLEAFNVNGLGVRNLAILSKELGFVLAHISTDYVFDGLKKKPYLETDTPHPLNVYGNTKLSGELFVRTITPKHYLVRTSGLYGIEPCRAKGGLNFVKLMLKLAKERDEIRVVDDEILTPTYTLEVANQLEKLTSTGKSGLYHMTSQGSCSWYEFAKKIFELSGIKTKLSKASPGEFPTKVNRPKYSVLENAELKKLGIDIMPDWAKGLEKYLKIIL